MSSQGNSPAAESPLAPSSDREERIRLRAYHLWQADGSPVGRDLEFWERARELDGMESHPDSGLISPDADRPPVESAALQDNLGEFPDRKADQGEHRQAPMTRSQARAAKHSR